MIGYLAGGVFCSCVATFALPSALRCPQGGCCLFQPSNLQDYNFCSLAAQGGGLAFVLNEDIILSVTLTRSAVCLCCACSNVDIIINVTLPRMGRYAC